jgi:hypothetical protein
MIQQQDFYFLQFVSTSGRTPPKVCAGSPCSRKNGSDDHVAHPSFNYESKLTSKQLMALLSPPQTCPQAGNKTSEWGSKWNCANHSDGAKVQPKQWQHTDIGVC